MKNAMEIFVNNFRWKWQRNKKIMLAFFSAILKFQIIYENADRNSISDFKRN